MKWSKAFIPTQKDTPSDADILSHALMTRAGMLHKQAPGVFSYLPLGLRAIQKVEAVVRQEMNRADAIEVLMPHLNPKELWDETGRWDRYGDNMFKLTDRKGQAYGLGPTHEEVITDIVRSHVHTSRDLPVTLYQIQTKFRDELRPRAGVLRGREFGMKDAYSFDVDEGGMIESYQAMEQAYFRIFERMGLDFVAIKADSGAIGGDNSVEFIALTQAPDARFQNAGDVTVVSCNGCEYGANIEKATSLEETVETDDPMRVLELLDTPNMGTIQELEDGLGIRADQAIKTILFQTDEPNNPVVAALVRGDQDVNEVKLANALGVGEVSAAGKYIVQDTTGADVGFAGPIGLPEGTRIIADPGIRGIVNGLIGANQTDRHYVNVNYERGDFEVTKFADLHTANEGDTCSQCREGTLEYRTGIELGHVFQLGLVYSEPMHATYVDNKGTEQTMWMGCYGIGTTRVLAAIIEQSHDKDGIIWPMEIAPYQVVVSSLMPRDETVKAAAESLYQNLQENGVEVLYDDREVSAGVKLKDADLVGIPLQVVIGRNYLKDGDVEFRVRQGHETEYLKPEQVLGHVKTIMKGE
jgi:prolyl-tRNA synthetase